MRLLLKSTILTLVQITPLSSPIFSAICYAEDKIETKMQQIIQAEDELKARLESLAEFVMQK